MAEGRGQGRLVCTGSVIVDLVLTVDRVPEPGGDTLASSALLTAGGGYNTLVAATRDGMPVVYAGQYGTGPFGDVVRRALAALDVEVVQPGHPDQDSGYCVALVDATSERTFVTTVGAEGTLTRGDLDRVRVHADDTVYVTGYSLAHPEQHGLLPAWVGDLPPTVRVLTDPSPLVDALPRSSLERLLDRTDVLSANARESRLMTGHADPAKAAVALTGRVRAGGHVVVRVGADGCWLAGPETGGSARQVPAFPVHPVDSTGAGDTHAAVLAAALTRGHGLEAAARRANAAAALSVTRPGPATAPSAAETDVLLGGAR